MSDVSDVNVDRSFIKVDVKTIRERGKHCRTFSEHRTWSIGKFCVHYHSNIIPQFLGV